MSPWKESEEVPRTMPSSKPGGINPTWSRATKNQERPKLPLALVPPGFEVRIVGLHGGRRLVQRLSNLGFTIGGKIKVVHTHNPGPVLVEVKDSRIALGRGCSMKIIVEEVE